MSRARKLMRLGIGSYAYVWWAGVPGFPAPAAPLTVDDLFEQAVSLGVSVVQVADNLPLDRLSASERRRLALKARELGIQVETGTCGIGPELLRRYLGIAREFASPVLRTLLDGPDHHPSAGEAAARLREVAPEFERAGVRLAIENHDRFKASELRRIIDETRSEFVGVCLDTANSLGCGEGIGQVLDALAEVVFNLHIKDFVVRRPAHNKGFIVEGAPAGKGLLDVPAVLAALARSGRDVNAIVELWPPPEEDVAASIEKEKNWVAESIRYLRTLIAQ